MDKFEQELLQKYEIRRLGDVEHFLSIRVIRDREKQQIWLLQDAYIENMATKFNVDRSKAPSTPLPTVLLERYERCNRK